MTFEALSGNPVTCDLCQPGASIAHITLTEDADLMAICPASANVLAKIAHGIADDALTTTVLALDAPLLLAPAMNTRMLRNAATQENLATLRQRGATILTSPQGTLACGTVGAGRMAEPPEIVAAMEAALGRQAVE
jgi:phosphopantothenoylcysteine decarboxylase/phosphopantothenate--cysteine ligase